MPSPKSTTLAMPKHRMLLGLMPRPRHKQLARSSSKLLAKLKPFGFCWIPILAAFYANTPSMVDFNSKCSNSFCYQVVTSSGIVSSNVDVFDASSTEAFDVLNVDNSSTSDIDFNL